MIPDDRDHYGDIGPKATQGPRVVNEGPPQLDPLQGRPIARKPTPLTNIEVKAETYSLEELQYKRRVLAQQIAPLEYLFGSGGDRGTAVRRQHRDGIYRLLLNDPNQPEKADGKLEKLANSHPDHTAFCTKMESQFVDYYLLKIKLQDIEELIVDRELAIRFTTKELGLQ
jgi:hypothetical protein